MKSLGINTTLAIILSPIILFCLIKLLYFKTTYAGLIITLLFVTLIFPLSDKKRCNHLKSIFTKDRFYKLRIIENISIGTILAILTFSIGKDIYPLIILIVALILSFYTSANTISLKFRTPFSKRPFEFTAGFRQYFPLLLLISSLFLIGLYVDNYNLSAVCLGSQSLIIANFFNTLENEYFVWNYHYDAKAFIVEKIRIAITYTLKLYTPTSILLLAFYPEKTYVTLLIIVYSVFIVILFSLAKYKRYPSEFNLGDTIVTALSILLPFLMIISLPYFYKKSISNIKLYLYDKI